MGTPTFVDIIDIEKERGQLHRGFCHRALGEGDNSGNAFGVRIFDKGNPAVLTGCTCVGYFIRADEITLVINGTISGNIAMVLLPAACYAKSGNFTLAIKVAGTGLAETMRIVDGTVDDTNTGTIEDPASEIPSIDSLMEVISRAETAAATINGLTVASELITGTRYKIKVTKS